MPNPEENDGEKLVNNKPARKKPRIKDRGLTPRERSFAQYRLAGMTQAEAYRAAGYVCAPTSAEVLGHRLEARPRVAEYIQKLREASWTKDALSVAEKRAFLAKAVRTPIAEIDETSPLAQEITIETTEHGQRKKVKAVSKLEAIRIDNAIAGDNYADRQDRNINQFVAIQLVTSGQQDAHDFPITLDA